MTRRKTKPGSRRRSRDAELLDLIGAIYDVALAPDELPRVLSRLTQSCGASLGVLGTLSTDGIVRRLAGNAEFEPASLALFEEKYTSPDVNPAIARFLGSPTCKIIRREEDVDDAAWERTGYYNDIYRPNRVYASFGAPVLRSEEYFVLLGVARPHRWGAFENDDFALTERALPHLRRGNADPAAPQ